MDASLELTKKSNTPKYQFNGYIINSYEEKRTINCQNKKGTVLTFNYTNTPLDKEETVPLMTFFPQQISNRWLEKPVTYEEEIIELSDKEQTAIMMKSLEARVNAITSTPKIKIQTLRNGQHTLREITYVTKQ